MNKFTLTAVCLLLLIPSMAGAVPIVPLGTLTTTPGTPVTDDVSSNSNAFDPTTWDFWDFPATTGQTGTVTVTPLAPFSTLGNVLSFGIWDSNTAGDTTDYIDIFSSTFSPPPVNVLSDTAADEMTAMLQPISITTSGTHRLAISATLPDGAGETLAYELLVDLSPTGGGGGPGGAVPEPATLSLGVLSLLGLAMWRPRHRRPRS